MYKKKDVLQVKLNEYHDKILGQVLQQCNDVYIVLFDSLDTIRCVNEKDVIKLVEREED
jgi:hypothetical protein